MKNFLGRINFLFCLMILIASCTKTKPSRVPENETVEVETPKVLLQEEQQTADVILSSYKGRGQGDLVEELFQEACSKNPKLKEQENKIELQLSETYKLLNEFEEYKGRIEEVWYSVTTHSMKIRRDSFLVKQISDQISQDREKFKIEIQPYENKIKEINSKIDQLSNALIELKIQTALNMMKGFQDNEIPPIQPLNEKSNLLQNIFEETSIEKLK